MSVTSTSIIHLAVPTDEKLLAAIGKIAICHGHLDHILRMTLKTLSGVTVQEALDATVRQGSRELRNRVRRLAKQRLGEGEPLVKIEALLEQSRRATERRNELLHGLWAQELDGEAVIRNEEHKFSLPPSIAELESLASELAAITKNLNFARLDGFLKSALET